MEYKYFYIAVRRYAKNKITREEFIDYWRDAQRQNGLNKEALS